MKTFSEIADRLLYASGFVPVLCDNEEKAKTIASSLKASDTHWPVHYFATDTSGEKLFEEFYPSHESPDFSRFDAIGVLPHRRPFTREQIVAVLEEMQVLLADQSYDKSRLVAFLYRAVPDFHHAATDKHLDDRM